uniref:Uncharacterized protein n=1 Tax=Anguilla anguilla TaxID=7936 RepID=A0A0E9SJ23_ANGAN
MCSVYCFIYAAIYTQTMDGLLTSDKPHTIFLKV